MYGMCTRRKIPGNNRKSKIANALFFVSFSQALSLKHDDVVALLRKEEHPCVNRVLTLATTDVPCRVLAKHENWEAELRIAIEEATTRH